MPRTLGLALLLVAASLVAVGVGLMFLPAGLIAAGLELGAGALFLLPVKEETHGESVGHPPRS